MASIGLAVGLGNVWRFPYLLQKNGGGLLKNFLFCTLKKTLKMERYLNKKKTLCGENYYNVMLFIMIQHFSTLPGAFLIPYFIMMVIEGLPLFYIEFAIGQRFQRSAIGCFKKIHPALTGIGISCIVISVLLCIYYVAVISWCFYYLFISLTSSLPFQMSNCEK